MATEKNFDTDHCSRREFEQLLAPLLESPRHDTGDEKGRLIKDHQGRILPSPIEEMALKIYNKSLVGLRENTRNHFDHVDIYQSTIIHMLEKDRIKFKPGSNLKGFLWTAMTNKWKDMCDRKIGRITTTIPEAGSGNELTSEDLSADAIIEEKQLEAAKRKCLDKITPPTRREAMEHRVGGLKLREIAILMDRPLATVTTWINDAKNMYKSCIQASGVLS